MTAFETNRQATPYGYNAYFECGGDRFDVNVTNFQYGWNLAVAGGGNSRQYQVTYPKRPEQTSLTVGLIFRDRQEYYEFGEWVRAYHLKATSGTNPPSLTFACGEAYAYYHVAITNLPMSFSWDMDSAPSIRSLTLTILRDMTGDVGTPSTINGSWSSLVTDRVSAWEVRGVGETAFSSKASNVTKERDISTIGITAASVFDINERAMVEHTESPSQDLRDQLGLF